MSLSLKKNILIGIMILSVLAMIRVTQPFAVDRSNYQDARSYAMGLSGLLAMIVITWQVILGIRPAFTRWIKDFFRVNGLHKRLGIATLAMILLHPIATVISYGTTRLYMFVWDFGDSFETWVTIGKIAFDMILVILASSILSRKIVSFRKRYWIHLLSYPTYIAIWLHARFTGTMIMQNPAVRAYWIGIGVVLAFTIAIRLAYQFGFLKMKTKILSHIVKTHDVCEISLEISDDIAYRPGQFIYIQKTQGGESHPFTVLSYDKKTRIMKIAYKALGKFTKDWMMQARHFDAQNASYCRVDGPYGTFTTEIQANKPVVCIAGGIGVTPFYDLVKAIAPDYDVSLVYLNPSRKSIVYREELESVLGNRCIHVLTREEQALTENEIVGHRINQHIINDIVGEKLNDAVFLICGGGNVIKSVKDMLLALGVAPSAIHYEPFEM